MKNTQIRFFLILLYVIVFILMLFTADYLIRLYRKPYFELNIIVLYSALFPFVLGLFLALPTFVSQLRKTGEWRYDWIKFIAVSIPVLYIAILPIVYYLLIPLLSNSQVDLFKIIYPPILVRYIMSGFSGNFAYGLIGVLYGYITLTNLHRVSIHKKEKIEDG